MALRASRALLPKIELENPGVITNCGCFFVPQSSAIPPLNRINFRQ